MSDSPVVIIYGSDGYGGYQEKGKVNPFKIDGYGSAGSPRGGVVSIQGVAGGTPQPVSVSALPLPTGAATETTLSSINTKTPALGQAAMAASSPVVIASNQTAIPITDNAGSITIDGTVTANAGTGPFPVSDNSGSLTIDTTQLPAALVGSRLDINNGAWLGSTAPSVGSKTSANSIPVVIASDQSAISVSDGGGSLTVDGTITANAGTGPWPVTDNGGSLTIDATSLPLPTGAATSVLQTTGNTSLGNIDTKIPALGQAAMAASSPVVIASNQSAVPVSGPLTDTQLRATAVPVSAASLPLPTGSATEATLSAINTKTLAAGQALMAASSPVVIASNQSAIPVADGGGSITIDGTVTANAGTGPFPVSDNAGSLTVDSTQLPAALVGSRLDINNGAWLGSTAPTVGQKTMANSVPVVISSDQAIIPSAPISSTSTLTNVAGSASSVTLLALNTSRRGATIVNDSAALLYVKLGTTASATSYTVRMTPNAYYEVPFGYTGRIDGIWGAATGNARITELT
jgi:hypothetical protein